MNRSLSRELYTPTMTESRHITKSQRATSFPVSGMYPAQFRRMERTEWDIVTKLKLTGFVIAAGLFFALGLCSETGFVFIVSAASPHHSRQFG
jgi:predicted urease superfamily metal-dependent hydrolase